MNTKDIDFTVSIKTDHINLSENTSMCQCVFGCLSAGMRVCARVVSVSAMREREGAGGRAREAGPQR